MVKDCIAFSDQKWLNWDPRVHRDVALTENEIFFSVLFRYWWKISLACFFPLKGMLSVMAVVRFYATSSAFSALSPASAAPGRRNIHDLRRPLTVRISIAQKPVCVPCSLSRGIRFSCKKNFMALLLIRQKLSEAPLDLWTGHFPARQKNASSGTNANDGRGRAETCRCLLLRVCWLLLNLWTPQSCCNLRTDR